MRVDYLNHAVTINEIESEVTIVIIDPSVHASDINMAAIMCRLCILGSC